MTLFEYVALVGATLIFTWSSLFEKVRKLWPVFFGCPQCIGFWVGALYETVIHPQPLPFAFGAGCAVSVGSLVTFLVVSWLEDH